MPKPPPICGNPVFLKWMEELRDAARDKNLKSAEGYAKACRSLQNCPVTYNRPRDLVVLQHIGEKTVGILEKKWKAWCEENGLVEESTPVKKKDKARAADTDDEATPSDSDLASKPKKARKPAKPKTYIPTRGSGAYGILLSLVLAIDDPEITIQVFLTKSEVIRGAQDYCDSSYEHSEKGTYFTAWSGMKSLINKGYVYVTGNPQKFCLTEEGFEVAIAMRNIRPEFAHLVNVPAQHVTAEVTNTKDPVPHHAQAASISIERTPSAGPSRHPSPVKNGNASRPERFQFWYIDSSGTRVPSLTSAMIRLDPTEFINLRKVEFRHSQRAHPFTSQLRLVDHHSSTKVRDAGNQSTMFAFIVEEEAPPMCSKFDESTSDKENQPMVHEGPLQKCAGSPLYHAVEVLNGAGECTTKSPTASPLKPVSRSSIDLPQNLSTSSSSPFSRTKSAPSTTTDRTPMSNLAAEAALRRLGHVQGGFSRSHSAGETIGGLSKPSRPGPRLSSHVPSPIPDIHDEEDVASPLSSTSSLPNFQPTDAIIYPPGSYEIVLIVDTREVESKSNRDKITETLAAKGIRVETRALRLGDMCWVARRIVGDLGGEEDECVLDYVVERKRLDDLCSSIRDGRYHEQCFRLSNSCINHVYYIVEDWQVAERMEYHGLQIMTAKSQIQVHNRFFLKETHRLSETIDFLTTMTKVIQSSHQNKSIHMIPTRYLSRSTYSALQTQLRQLYPDESYLISFQAYQELNDKSASQTVREKFARMLLCVKGMSAERVSAMLDLWETPKALWDTLKGLEAAAEEDGSRQPGESAGGESGEKTKAAAKKRKRGKEVFFADAVKGEGRRKIGDALSKEIWRAFMGDDANVPTAELI